MEHCQFIWVEEGVEGDELGATNSCVSRGEGSDAVGGGKPITDSHIQDDDIPT